MTDPQRLNRSALIELGCAAIYVLVIIYLPEPTTTTDYINGAILGAVSFGFGSSIFACLRDAFKAWQIQKEDP